MAAKKNQRRNLPPPGEPWSTEPELMVKDMNDPAVFEDVEESDTREELKRRAEEEWASQCYLCDTSPAVYYGMRDEQGRNRGTVKRAIDLCEVHAQEYAECHRIPLPPPNLRVVK